MHTDSLHKITRFACTGLTALLLLAGALPAFAQGGAKKDRPDSPTGEPAGEPSADGAAPAAAGTPPGTSDADIDALRQEYLRLRDELFRSRARAASVASAMYSTRLQLFLTYGSGRFYAVTRATIRLDGANVYDDTSGGVASDSALRFEGFVAPGRHVVSVRLETTSKDDERFTMVTENTFAIQAPGGKDVILTAKAKDDGDMGFAWKKKEKGSYQPSLSVSVQTKDRPGAPAGAAGDKKKASKPAKKSSAVARGERGDDHAR